MNRIVLTGLFLLLSVLGFPQGEWNNWYFGWHAAMTFNSGDPVGIAGSALTSSGGSCSTTVSDSVGTLLFYANGWKIWNRNNVVMPNGSGLIGGNLCQQPVFSAPVPGYANRYYVFTVGDPSTPDPPIGLHYSVVDMSLQGGLGDVISIQKNIYVPGGDSAVDQLTGTRGHNNKDIWIVVRKHTPVTHYLAYHIDALGLNTIPVVSPTTMNTRFRWQFGNLVTMRGGDMKISYDGKFLVCHDSLTEICRFNDTTGVVTPLFKVYIDVNICGAEFSIDSKYLYVTTRGSAIPNQCHLYQFDMGYLDSLSFMQHKVLIGYGAALKLQMGPNWKIYTNLYNGLIDSLNCINYPSLAYPECNYQRNVVCLLGNGNNGVLVQFLQRYKVYIHSSSNCQLDPIQFTGDIWPPPDSLHWDFGDPASGALNYSTLDTSSHVYTSAGTYTVELFIKHIDHRTDTTWQTITVIPAPQVNLGPDRTICLGDSVTFDAGACSGCTYLWRVLPSGITVGTSQTFKTGLAGIYTASVTSPNTCVGRDTVQLITTAAPVVANSPLIKTICSGESTNIPLISAPPGASFHWTASLTSGNVSGFSADSGLIINQVLVNSLPTPGIVTYHITPEIGNCTGSIVDFPVTVNPGDSVDILIASSTNNVCAGTSVTFTATPVNGGTNPTFQWKVNGTNAGTNNPVFTYTPVNNDKVSCILTSSNTTCTTNNPATSDTIFMIVNPNLLVSVSVSVSANPVCAGTIVTFTAIPVNGGTAPVYQWYKGVTPVGSNSNTYSYIPANGDVIKVVMTSSPSPCLTGSPATSNAITMTVNPLLTASVTIATNANPVCAGTSVTFTATPVNEGTTPAYQWYKGSTPVGSNSTIYSYIPANGDVITVVMTSSASPCLTGSPATSNAVTMTVNPILIASVTIAADANPVCAGTSVKFTATPVNGGTTPAYQWYKGLTPVGSNSDTYSYIPANGDMITVVMTSSASPCLTGSPATSNAVTMTVGLILPANVTITASANPVCAGTIVAFTATPVNGGTTPVYQWKVNGINAGTNSPNFSYIPQTSDSIRCIMTSSLACISNNPASSNKIVMTASSVPVVTFTLCFDSITTVNAKPIKLKGGIPLGGTYSGPGVNSVTGVFTPSSAGMGTKIITYSYTNVALCSASKTKTIIVQSAPAFTCGNNLTDIRDGKVYPTIQFGSQCWMASNLNYGTIILASSHQRDNCIPEKYCYNDLTANCQLGTAAYQWDELMRYDDTPGLQGFCPPGWHVPTEAEWNTLFANWTNNAFAGAPLKYSGYSGFNALMSGVRHLSVQWDYQDVATFFWSSTPYGAYKAWSHGMNDYDPSVAAYPSSRANAFSIRCLKD